ncbi:trigger factor [bacterium]|nr:trigger factor [bacterium]
MQLTSSLRTILRNAGLAGAIATALVAAPLLGGCGSSGDGTGTSATTSSTSAASSAATASDGTASSNPYANFSYSDGLTDEGLWDGVDVSDYVTLADYKGIAVPSSAVEPTDDAVDAQVNAILSTYATTAQVTDRAVADGDTVNIDYVGTINGVEFDGGNTQGKGTTVTIGKTQYIDDFLDQLVGHTPGETFDVHVTFPDDYGVQSLDGQDATFSVTINYISEQQNPELTDDWVAQNLGPTYGWQTADEMRDALRDSLRREALGTYVENYLVENSTFAQSLPQSMLEYQNGSLVSYYQGYASAYGVDLSAALPSLAGVSSIDDLIASNRENIDVAVKRCLVLQAVAEAEGLTVSDDEVTAYIGNVMGASAASNMSAYQDAYGLPYLRFCALQDKALQLIEDNVDEYDDADGTTAANAAGSSAADSADGAVATKASGKAARATASSAHDDATASSSARDAAAASSSAADEGAGSSSRDGEVSRG